MAANYIASAEQTMMLVRRIAAHLAIEPNLPAPGDLTRGEVDAWIRALNTGIHGRVVDLLALPVLECLLYMRGRNLGCKTKHLRRAPSEMFHPVVVNPWVREDVILNPEHLPWIPGDHHVTQNHDNAENAVVTDEQDVVVHQEDDVNPDQQDAIVHQGDDVEADFTSPGGEGTQLENTQLENTQLENTQLENTQLENTQPDGSEQRVNEDDDSPLQTTELRTVETNAAPLPETSATKTTYRTRSQAVQNADVTMEDAPEQDESSSDDPDRIYCICNDSVDGGTMVQCDNHRDSVCKGKWFHLKCVGLTRTPADDVHWFCMECRKKLRRGIFSKGMVDKKQMKKR